MIDSLSSVRKVTEQELRQAELPWISPTEKVVDIPMACS